MMTELAKRTISGLLLIIWTFLTILYSSKLLVISVIICLLIILFFEWPKLPKIYYPFFIIYPFIPFCLIIYLQLAGFKTLNLFAFAACFLFDSSSYVFGKLLGKHKIAPTISPGKTLEGYLGGSLTVIITYLIYIKWQTGISLNSLLNIGNFLIPLIISFLAFAGDLFESYLKRKSGIKDFGNVLPGHGGLFDRFDSILFVIVFVFLFRNYLINILG